MHFGEHGNQGLAEADDDSPAIAARNAGLGLKLFFVYLVAYAGFVLVSAFAPARMAVRPWGGINLAIWWGFGLLGLALVMSLVYSWLCRARGNT